MTKSLHSPAQKHLQKRLKDARLEFGQTQAAVAATLGKPQSFVAKYEMGERRLDAIELLQVLRAIRLQPVELFKELDSLV
jgi:transcriptional regulator with XRE-family HTH domain